MYGDICSGKLYASVFLCVTVCLGAKWGFTGVVKPTELFLGLVSLYSHAESNCSVVLR